RCERFARRSRDDTLQPVRLALAEATATSAEILRVEVRDVSDDRTRVWLTASRSLSRWGYLTEWGIGTVSKRLDALEGRPANTLIAYTGDLETSATPASTISIGLAVILQRAELLDDSAKPRSIRLWAGRKVWDDTRDLEEVRHRLGLRGH